MTTDFALLGLAVGIGIVMIFVGVRPRRSPLHAEMAIYDPASAFTSPDQIAGIEPTRPGITALGTRLAALTETAGQVRRRDQDIAVTGRTLEGHATVVATATLTGIASPILLTGLLTAVGLRIPILMVVALCATGGAIGLLAPLFELRRASRQARERFLRAFSCWLELVALAQAGGMGVESALQASARISPDPAFARIRHALERARHSATTPWDELGRLGADIGVEELNELSASLGLAGLEGARIRSSLTAKSESLRRRQMTEEESRANSTTERLFLPSIVLMLGFMIFLLYPAGVRLAHLF